MPSATGIGSATAEPTPGFGHAYYLDGAFKNYHFNNIAWGKAKDIASPVVNCSAFQEIISYQNTFFNNTIFNFYTGSRRQAPEAGRNKYLGNIWDGIGQFVFRHADPAKTAAEGNAKDAGPAKEHFAPRIQCLRAAMSFTTSREMGVLEPSGRWLPSFDDFKARARKEQKHARANWASVSQTLAAAKSRPRRLPTRPRTPRPWTKASKFSCPGPLAALWANGIFTTPETIPRASSTSIGT